VSTFVISPAVFGSVMIVVLCRILKSDKIIIFVRFYRIKITQKQVILSGFGKLSADRMTVQRYLYSAFEPKRFAGGNLARLPR